jgi:hypothetical protein
MLVYIENKMYENKPQNNAADFKAV